MANPKLILEQISIQVGNLSGDSIKLNSGGWLRTTSYWLLLYGEYSQTAPSPPGPQYEMVP